MDQETDFMTHAQLARHGWRPSPMALRNERRATAVLLALVPLAWLIVHLTTPTLPLSHPCARYHYPDKVPSFCQSLRPPSHHQLCPIVLRYYPMCPITNP